MGAHEGSYIVAEKPYPALTRFRQLIVISHPQLQDEIGR